jgi:poly(A) polymerase
LHDVGKPRCVGRTPDRYTFYGHEQIGARLAGDIGRRLKLSNDDRERIEWLVEKHQYLSDAPRMKQSKLKKTLAHPGRDELLRLHRADALATGKSTEHVDFCLKKIEEWGTEILPPPLVTGTVLIGLGVQQGPIFKKLLDAAYDAQLEGLIKTEAGGVEFVKQLFEHGPGAPHDE